MKFSRTFSANAGDYSTGTAGPDQIEYDLDQIAKNLDPTQTDGGIGVDNLKDGAVTTAKLNDSAVTDVKLGDRIVDSTLAGGSNAGTLTQILSWLGKIVKAITGKTSWFDLPTKSIEELNAYDAFLLSQVQGTVLGQIPDGSITDAKLSGEAKQNLIYETAGGTGTAITLTTAELTNGHSKTFIASANNSSAATTINGVPLYKPNTTDAPTLIAGKAYTIWYDSTGGCFFLKASAEGDAVVADVLAGKKFSNDSDTGILGTMTNQGAKIITPSAIQQTIPAGYHNGSGYVVGDADLTASNIASGITIFGIQGTHVGSFIKSIQNVYIGIGGSGASSGSVAITPVDANCSLVIFNGNSTKLTTPNYSKAIVSLSSDGTTVYASRNSGDDGSPGTMVYCTVIEFYSDMVKSKQQGEIIASNAEASSTITSVNMNNCIFAPLGFTTTVDVNTYEISINVYCYLSSSTTVTAGRFSDYGSVTVGWNVIEFN